MDKQLIFGRKIEGIDYRLRPAVYAVILNSSNDEVVTVQTPDGYYWLPGGGLEANESHESCLKREMLEETGYDAEIGSYIGKAMQYFSTSRYEHILNDGHFYLAKLLTQIQEPTEDDHDIKWVKVNDIDELLYHKHQSWAVKEAMKLAKGNDGNVF